MAYTAIEREMSGYVAPQHLLLRPSGMQTMPSTTTVEGSGKPTSTHARTDPRYEFYPNKQLMGNDNPGTLIEDMYSVREKLQKEEEDRKEIKKEEDEKKNRVSETDYQLLAKLAGSKNQLSEYQRRLIRNAIRKKIEAQKMGLSGKDLLVLEDDTGVLPETSKNDSRKGVLVHRRDPIFKLKDNIGAQLKKETRKPYTKQTVTSLVADEMSNRTIKYVNRMTKKRKKRK